MTLEEKAEEYADRQYAVFEPCAGERYNVEQAYIAGANEVKADCDFALEGKDVEIKELKEQIENYEQERQQLWQRIDKYKEDLKKLRIAFIQSQAMALSGGNSFEDLLGKMQDVNFGVSN